MKNIEAYYTEKAKTYEDTFDNLYYKIFDTITWRYIEPYLPTNSKALILDAGGGTGRWSIQIARKGYNVILMDSSEGMLKVAAKKIEEKGLQHKIIVKQGDITKIDYDDEVFDMILCEHVLFLFREPDIVIKELNRVLKKKMRLVISAHNRYVQSLLCLPDKPSLDNLDDALKILHCQKYGSLTENGKVTIHTWTPLEFRTMLERNGFLVEKIIGKGYTMPLRISKEVFMKKEFSEELFNKILQLEFALCEKADALALAGHLQAIAQKL